MKYLCIFVMLSVLVVSNLAGMGRWDGRVALVTGASSGIGAAIAKAFAKRGIIVIGVARRVHKIQEYAKTSSGVIHARQCDLTDEKQIIDLFQWINNSALGGVDILVNNAGVFKTSSLIDGATIAWKSILDLNVLALSITTREALVSMKQKEYGHIFNINSVAGHTVPRLEGFHVGMYSASKFAVTALTEALRIELAEQKSPIKVTSISPGSVYTEMVRDLGRSLTGAVGGADGLERADDMGPAPPGFLEVEDVVEAVLYALGTRPSVQVNEIFVQAMAH